MSSIEKGVTTRKDKRMHAQKTQRKNGTSHSVSTVPATFYQPPIGRAPRKPEDLVRKGLLAAARSFKEITSSWAAFAPLSEDGTRYEIEVRGARHVHTALGFLIESLKETQRRIDEQIAAAESAGASGKKAKAGGG